jgi:hypothetical protein
MSRRGELPAPVTPLAALAMIWPFFATRPARISGATARRIAVG